MPKGAKWKFIFRVSYTHPLKIAEEPPVIMLSSLLLLQAFDDIHEGCKLIKLHYLSDALWSTISTKGPMKWKNYVKTAFHNRHAFLSFAKSSSWLKGLLFRAGVKQCRTFSLQKLFWEISCYYFPNSIHVLFVTYKKQQRILRIWYNLSLLRSRY